MQGSLTRRALQGVGLIGEKPPLTATVFFFPELLPTARPRRANALWGPRVGHEVAGRVWVR